MSIEFNISCNEKISYRKIYENFSNFEIKLAYDAEEGLLLGRNKFFIPFESSRGIYTKFIEKEDNIKNSFSAKIFKTFLKNKKSYEYNIKINSLSSPEDFRIAIKLVKAIANITNSKVETENENYPLSIEEFNNKYNEDWINKNKTHGVFALHHLIFKENGIVTIECCRRNYYIGKKVMTKFANILNNEELLYQKIIENIKEVQFFNEETYNIPGLFEENNSQELKTFVIIFPNKKCFLYKVDFILISISEKQIYRIPFENLENINNNKFSLIDEYQYFIEPLTEEELIKIGEENE